MDYFENRDDNKSDHDSLKIYLFDRVVPIAYIEMILGGIIAVFPTVFMILNIKMFTKSTGALTDGGIAMLIAVTVLFWGGLLVFSTGNYKRGVCEHGFLAERNGHIYAFSMNLNRLKDGNIPAFGKIGKVINGFNSMDNNAFYTKKMDELKKSPELYDEVNEALDNNYSYLYSFRDIHSKKFTAIERKAFISEYNRLKNMSGSV